MFRATVRELMRERDQLRLALAGQSGEEGRPRKCRSLAEPSTDLMVLPPQGKGKGRDPSSLMETLIDQAHFRGERSYPRSPVTRNARYGLRGVRVGEATHPGPSQDLCRASEEIVNCLEFDLTRVDTTDEESTQLADRNVVRRLLDRRSSKKFDQSVRSIGRTRRAHNA